LSLRIVMYFTSVGVFISIVMHFINVVFSIRNVMHFTDIVFLSGLWCLLFLTFCCYCYTSRYFPHSWLITGFVARLTRRVPLVDQELLPFRNAWFNPRILVGFLLLYL
jgi:hypothetical protein